jgi:hypothetical protein
MYMDWMMGKLERFGSSHGLIGVKSWNLPMEGGKSTKTFV